MSLKHRLTKREHKNYLFPIYGGNKQIKNLHPWNVGEEDSNTKTGDGGNKDIDVIRRRVLKRAQFSASSREQVTSGR